MTNFYSKMCYIPNFFLLPQAPSPAGRPQWGNPSPQTPRLGRSLPKPPCWGSPKRLFVYSLFTVYELFTKCLLFTVYCLPIRGNLFTVYDLFTNSWDHKLFINMFISYKLVNMWHCIPVLRKFVRFSLEVSQACRSQNRGSSLKRAQLEQAVGALATVPLF